MSERVASPHASRAARWSWAVYAALLVVILAQAGNLRFSLPQTPLIDPDFWGYLHPGLSKLTGGPFEHTFGRNFVYPGFLFLVLRVFGDYRSICVCQHALGLLTGVLLAGAWNVLCACLAGPVWSRIVARFLGLALVADFLLSRSPLVFEHTVRPEAVFPFFLAGSFLLNFGALHAGFVVPRPRTERWCLGLNLFVTVVAQSLKPSLGLGIIVANLPLAFWFVRRGTSWRIKNLVAGTAVVVTVLTLWLPERLLARRDVLSATFLPATFFTVHAKLIHEQIVDDLRTGHTAPYQPEWLAMFNHQLEDSLDTASHPDQSPYRTLGFNPDYLLYVNSVFYPAFGYKQSKEMAAFCMHYYWRTWRYRPAPMLAKIGAQLGEVYHFRVKLGNKHRLARFLAFPPPGKSRPYALSGSYQDAWACCQFPTRLAVMRASPGGPAYLDQLKALGNTPAEVSEPARVNFTNAWLVHWHLPLLVLTALVGGLLAACAWRSSLPLVAGVFLLWTVNFLMFLTVGTIHSLEPNRYVENQRVCTVFGELATLLLLWQGVTLLLGRLRASQVWSRLRPPPRAPLPLP